MAKLGLRELISPLTTDEFFGSHWPGTPLYLPPTQDKLRELIELPELQSLESVLAGRVEKVRACLPDFSDEYSSIFVDPADALKAYRNHMTLVFDGMQTQSSSVAAMLTAIQSDLGLITGGGHNDLSKARSMAYATPAGGKTKLHFDANANFVVQLLGTKRWALAPNTSVKNPTDRYTSGTGEISITLERQCEEMLLEELPQGALEFLMEPGAVLFVPRGYWHETTTEEDSLSLNFTFGQTTWADVFSLSLREHLLQDSEWRELAYGLAGPDPMRTDKALARFETLLKRLREALPEISGTQLLADCGFLKNRP